MRFKLFVISFLLGISSLSAWMQPSPGAFGFQAEWLYMLHASDNPYYVFEHSRATDLPIGKRKHNDQEWHSGFRIIVDYAFCECNNLLAGRWTHFKFSESDDVGGGSLASLLGNTQNDSDDYSGSASINDQYQLDIVEILLTHNLCLNDCCFDLALSAGLQYGRFDWKEKAHYLQSGNDFFFKDLKQNYEMWGLGPELALDLRYTLCGSIGFSGRVAGAVLASKVKDRFFETEPDDGDLIADQCDEEYWRLIPTTNLRLGFDTSCASCLCGWNLKWNFEVGYETVILHRGYYRNIYPDDTNDTYTLNEYSNFMLHGPYVAVGVSY